MPVTVESTEPAATPASETEKKPVLELKEQMEQPKAAKTPKELEKEEPLLQENPHRFVLFPLKYHEIVRVTSRNTSLFRYLPCPLR
jgi:ribonucleoside-diphosphate reductase subunit M2